MAWGAAATRRALLGQTCICWGEWVGVRGLVGTREYFLGGKRCPYLQGTLGAWKQMFAEASWWFWGWESWLRVTRCGWWSLSR